SAHGAGLMAVPFALGAAGDPHAAHAGHGGALLAGPTAGQGIGMLATIVHAAGYLIVAALLAVLVYEKFGLRLLRTAWVNVDLIWAIALIVTGVLTPLI